MKIAVTSQGKTLDSQLDPRFGRAAYILVIDTVTLEFEVIDNADNKNAFKGAGIQAAARISDSGAEVLLTGFCGPNAFETLDAAGVKVVNDQTGKIIDVVQKFKQGGAVYAESANKDGHW
ncbi:MAG: NifB/NifX family molybdenum-iron cluster-binding protein [Proteobacteria bacterium]|nr:NifB/NifX family molybdenum-iron cluster-binding protein [Pseudomonadota bacterium]MBU1389871.1 NifB/NifX family molybdenum-iron cluster-binding protein [Pseudomonadota bacterium]MBU1543880.1 NifB/NifX family molybdenum-iron cluster-binding protein [Pseudomonadota bacterium]MBU2482233.1 NifB/NifX family molybdenum-iron cluster-binding protein [Pseudomonadota bacterium]